MNIVRLGDPHLGKSFTNGVPLHRRGERERMQWNDFGASVLYGPGDLHVCMGDLFDKMVVPFDVILKARRIYVGAALNNPNTEYVVIRGNHDASKDNSITTAYDVFAALMEGVENVHVLQNDPLCIEGKLFVPWQPHRAAAEVLPDGHFSEVYGHWDVIDFGNANPNLVPIEQLKDRTPVVFTGHDHNPRVIHNGFVHVTGSMQPYNHAEDADAKLYVTCTLDSLPSDPTHHCIRLLLRPGEVVPDDLDCLQLTVKKVEEIDTPAVELGAFDLKQIFDDTLEEVGVGPDLKATLWEKMSC